MNNKIDRINKLIEILNQASDSYYNSDKLLMSDKEFDKLFDELKSLEQETGYISTSSPTQKVGYEVKTKLEKVTHSSKMLSLDKTKNISELKKFIGDKEGILSWKEDGLTIVLSYDNGKLIDAVTRGNGEIGSRILHNAMAFKFGIPITINYKEKLVVRGEALISKEDFDKINVDGIYANPRNLTSGSIMALDNKIAKNRCLQFKAFSIAECDKHFNLYSQQLDWLKQIGFNPVEYFIIDRTTIESEILNFKSDINNYEFATDGLVLKYNDLKYGENLGFTSHHNLDSLAFKWKDSTVETTLRDIQFQVGRTGVLTPVANFDEIFIEGSMVGKASLHNISILKALELGIGDIISVYKANLIIPQLDSNLTRSNTFKLPTKCPECGGEVEIRQTDNAEFLICTNPNCKAKLVQKISHYVSRDAMNIIGLSEATIEKFINEGFIKDIPDLYNLYKYESQIMELEGFGSKSFFNLINAIEESKHCKLERLLFGLGFSNVGKGTAKDISKYFKGSIMDFMDAIGSHFDFTTIKDIGEITNYSIYEWFENDKNIDIMADLVGILEFEDNEQKQVKSEIKENKLLGKHVYPTGVFNLKKADLKLKLEEVGAIVESGFKKSLDYLICGGDTSKSGKIQKAIDNNVPLMTEEEMMEILGL